jgi:hypothetical protein
MSSYHPLNPSVYYAYRIENKEIFKKIVTTAFEWYKQSDRHIEYPELFDDCETCYNNLIDIIEVYEDGDEIGYILDEDNGMEFFDEYIYSCVPFSINHIEEDNDIYMILCYDKSTGSRYYNEIGSVLEYGDDVNDLIRQNDVNFHNPNILTHCQDFFKFLNDADLNDIKYKFTWTFLHD